MEQCECGRPKGQCVQGDMKRCPALDDDELDNEPPLYTETDDDNY